MPFNPVTEFVHVHKEFKKKMHYVPVSKSVIDQVHISIKTETGSNVPFVTGKTMIKLRFRRKKYKYFVAQHILSFCTKKKKKKKKNRYKDEFFGGTDKRILQDHDRIAEITNHTED